MHSFADFSFRVAIHIQLVSCQIALSIGIYLGRPGLSQKTSANKGKTKPKIKRKTLKKKKKFTQNYSEYL